MNKLSGQIQDIRHHQRLSLVRILVGEVLFSSIVVQSPENDAYIQPGKEIKVLFKETEVTLALPRSEGISMQNQLICEIDEIEQGELLSRIRLIHPAGGITSIITRSAVEQLGLRPGMQVKALVKTNEIMLSQ